MQRRRITVAAVVVVAAGAAVAFTLPSMAGTTPSSDEATATRSGILAAMQRDMGLSADQARARLQRSRWASGVSARMRARTGADFGGAWLASDGTTLKIAVTGKDAAAAVRKAGAEPVMVEHSEQSLATAEGELDAASSASGIPGWYVDTPTNKLVVVAKPGRTSAAAKWAGK